MSNSIGLKIPFTKYNMNDVKKASSQNLFTVVSTFAGGGGGSIGYRMAGGKILLTNEFVDEAAKTYSRNFPDVPVDTRDIREITVNGEQGVLNWLKSYGIKKGGYDILDGSPPCSCFSSVGKGEEHAYDEDVRYSDTTQSNIGTLIHEYVTVALSSSPKVTVLENVPEIKKSSIFTEAYENLSKEYIVDSKILDSCRYGVPQKRRRLFMVGVRKDLAAKLDITSPKDILKLYPKGSSYEPTWFDALDGFEVDENERELCLSATRKGTSYEVLKMIQQDPERNFRIVYDNPEIQNKYFNTNRVAIHQPVHTLTQLGNQLNSMGGQFHPLENRQHTIGELKRIHGLPDDFILTGSYNQRAERIGRCVTSPVLKSLSQSLYENVLLPLN